MVTNINKYSTPNLFDSYYQQEKKKPPVKKAVKPAPKKSDNKAVQQIKPQKISVKSETKPRNKTKTPPNKAKSKAIPQAVTIIRENITDKSLISPLPRAPKVSPRPRNYKHDTYYVEGNLILFDDKPLPPLTMKEMLRMQHEAYHHEGMDYKVSADYRLVTEEEYRWKNGKYYFRYGKSVLGKIRRSYYYYKKVTGTGYRKGYRFERIKVKEAKEVGIYQEPAFLEPKVALKEINELRKIVNKNKRITKKYDR